ncbi:MAG: peptidylprolyl isomerase [Elusimicrobia bacterium]|nr:peptidylprolyl isomerase [Elusimicrobiota bacterium]
MAASLAAQVEAASWEQAPGLYAVFHTNAGDMVCSLFENESPKTVANFVDLATGAKEWTDPKTGEKKKSRFYDGLIFHRVIPGFMIQGGDPLGTGTGGPGYRFEDEVGAGLRFDEPGKLAMANAGPNTNGSQFFITDMPRENYPKLPSHLNGRHTIFGQLVSGWDVLKYIATTGRDQRDKPDNDVVITELVIRRVEEPKKAQGKGKPE